MRIEAVILSHHTSPIEVRERAALNGQQLEQAVQLLLEKDNIESVVVLSTCNRCEIYISPYHHHDPEGLQKLLQEVTKLSEAESKQAIVLRDSAVVDHLFKVTAGLDSQMLGEVQILGQVKDALDTAQSLHSTNAVLNKLFSRAVECGKLVRNQTEISRGAVSVASAAVEMAGRIFGAFETRNVLLVGAGETARLVARHLRSAGVVSWRISNRTEANAQVVADLLGGRVVAFPPSQEDLIWADIVVSATSSVEPVITAPVVKLAQKKRRSVQLLLDLAVPRDTDPQIRDLDDIYLYGVDDFQDLVSANIKSRAREAVHATKVVSGLVTEFSAWYRENRVAPTIQQLQTVLEELRKQEVDLNLSRFHASDREQVERFSKSLMRKVTSLLINNLKRASNEEDDLTTARALTLALAREDQENVNEVLEKLNRELSH